MKRNEYISAEGATVGSIVGTAVGDSEGSADGMLVGEPVGSIEGATVGADVGSAEGWTVGCVVGIYRGNGHNTSPLPTSTGILRELGCVFLLDKLKFIRSVFPSF